eukprot:gb/GECH01010034.1/.p1 GENE.gb/GECH01010034.1/~~gb/GECH01010034.1/.p1  ORF type:complete len:249 (+),score=54.14 gb/GECH01010034.1/:1-747(+)
MYPGRPKLVVNNPLAQHNSTNAIQHLLRNLSLKYTIQKLNPNTRFYSTEGQSKKAKKSVRQDIATAEDPLLDEEFTKMKINTIVYHGQEQETVKKLFTQPPTITEPSTTDEMLSKHFNIKKTPTSQEVFTIPTKRTSSSMVDTFFDNLSNNLYTTKGTRNGGEISSQNMSIPNQQSTATTEEFQQESTHKDDSSDAYPDVNNGELSRHELASQLVDSVNIDDENNMDEEEDIAALDELIQSSKEENHK